MISRADAMAAEGHVLEAAEMLQAANAVSDGPALQRRVAELRYLGFDALDRAPGFDRWPAPCLEPLDEGPARIPEISRAELDAETLRRSILSHGSLLVRGLFDDDQVAACVSGIDRAFEVRDEGPGAEARRSTSWFTGLRLPPDEAQTLGRHWVSAAGGMLTCDSPKMLCHLLDTYGDIGLREVVGGYLGERPVLSANKWTLRRVPLTASTDWHQDGAFLGEGIRALNVWIGLSDCGVDSPGMDLLPRRLDHVVETGTGGAIFDWAVGPTVVEQLAVDAPVVRPVFKAGDALLFDDLFLHRTAIEPTMTRPRYAIEAWFFAPSVYPSGQVPIVW